MVKPTTEPDPVLLASLHNDPATEAGSLSVNFLDSQTVPHRWYFNSEHSGTPAKNAVNSLSRPNTKSRIVKSNESWEPQLPPSNVSAGWYSLVFCVSLDNLKTEFLESITFDAQLGDFGRCNLEDTSTLTVVRKDDIEELPKSGRILLHLHRQANISDSSKYLYPSVTIKTSAEPPIPLSFEMHHIELATSYDRLSSDAEDPVYTLYGHDKPDQFIKVGDSSTHPVKICAYDVSDMGNYVATLYLINDMAYLDIWDIQHKGEEAGKPQSITKAYAHISFQSKDKLAFDGFDYDIAVSSTGLQAAVCSLHKHGETFEPLSIYSCGTVIVADHQLGQPWSLQKTTIAETYLAGAFGYIAFRTLDPGSNQKKNERFLKFNGVAFEVYQAADKWRRLFTLPINIRSMPEAMIAKTLFHGTRGRLFAYTGTRGLVLIWDIKTHRIVSILSNISVPVDTRPVMATLSRDGSKVAIAVEGMVRVHDVQSGIQLGCLKEGLNAENAFEMDFVKDYLSTLNYATLTAKHGSQPNTRSVVRLRDMAIVDTYKIHPEYLLQTPQAIGAPIFGFDHGAIVNIIKHKDHTPIEEISEHANCNVDVNIDIHQLGKNQLIFPALEGMVFELTASDVVATWSSVTILQIALKDALGTTLKSAKISIVWNLSTIGTSVCELAYIWKLHPDDAEHAGDYHYRRLLTAKACEHEKRVQITLSPAQLIRHGKIFLDSGGKANDIVTVPISRQDTFPMTEDERLAGGVEYLANVYAESDSTVQESILHYLKNCIHPSDKYPESSLMSLCRAWSFENSASLEAMAPKLLPSNCITWIPHLIANRAQNPLEILFPKMREEPTVCELIKIIAAYCTKHATKTKDTGFLAPVFASMPQFMKQLPDYAREFLPKVSYMDVSPEKHAFILHNHKIAYPPKVFLNFLKLKRKSLAKTKHPVLQLNHFPSAPNLKNNKFQQSFFIASFDMLWNYKDNPMVQMAAPNDNVSWEVLYRVLTLKLRLRSHRYVECHNFNVEVFDNPAIAALVAYKWNTIGFMYWSFRFTFQLIFYILVIAAALLQAIKYGKRYRTVYNILDVLGYTVPVVTSVQQILVLYENNPDGYTKTLSFAVLIVFLHALFELRVFRKGIVTFAISTLHLLRACPVVDGCKDLTIKFSDDFFGALSTTYFFMGGRYDQVEEEFDIGGWEFHVMMAVYFFFTVVVMLNVLIALVNVAFAKGDEKWRLVWNESRLRYIESAENMSYHIHGFRQAHNWFPKEIFYSAPLQEVTAYRKKYPTQPIENNNEEDNHQRAARTQSLGSSQDGDTVVPRSIHGEAEETNKEKHEDHDGDGSKDEIEEVGDGDDVVNEEVVKNLKEQVVKLQDEVSRQFRGQQRVLEQLQELLLAMDRT
ncbi:hypothetical protein BGZ72_000043 [Mortierella alpina]|nr:hypothetical protein BGZ72_000043 [Mortierella alpina]